MVMDDQSNNNIDGTSSEIAELQTLLMQAEQQKDDPEAEIAAMHFRELLDKRMKGSTKK